MPNAIFQISWLYVKICSTIVIITRACQLVLSFHEILTITQLQKSDLDNKNDIYYSIKK